MCRSVSATALATFLALVLAAPVAAGEPTTIGITGGWPVSVTLEIGQLSITVNAHEGGGVTSVKLDGPTVVRVRRLSDCVPLVRFVAQPGGSYWIYPGRLIPGHEDPWVKDLHGGPTDSGPGMELHYRRACPALPDSSTGPVPPDGDVSPVLFLAAVAAAAFVLTLRATSPRVRTRGRGTWPGRRRRMLKIARGLVLATVLVVAASGPVAAGEPTTIGITGGWSVSVTLEVGGRSITLKAHEGGGVTDVQLDGPTVVRVRRLSDCAPVLRFVAQPGGDYWIYPGDGAPWVKDLHGGGTDSGPGFDLQNRLHCPALPDSSTGPVPPDRDGSPVLLLAAVFAAAFVVALRVTSPRARTRGRGTWPGRP